MNSDICEKFATKVQQLREAKKLTKSQLSALAGLDMSYIGKIERCQKYPNIKTIAKLAEGLDVPVKDLFDF